MRITRDMLVNVAEDTVEKRTSEDGSILAAYLVGTVTEGEPLLGGTADIDLAFVYQGEGRPREIVRLTEDVHLDILHHAKSDYEPARDLRHKPWWGTTVYAYRPLYDPEHFLDFTQATVRGLFYDAENVIERASTLLDAARNIWIGFHNETPAPGPNQVWGYLEALERGANAVACLTGPPLTERRFLLNFPERAEESGEPGLYPALIELLGGSELQHDDVMEWLSYWDSAYDLVDAIDEAPVQLHPYRRAYYRRAFDGLLESEQPLAALWPLLRSWTLAAKQLNPASPAVYAWSKVCENLNLMGDKFDRRLAGLDAYLDQVEVIFERWRVEQGV